MSGQRLITGHRMRLKLNVTSRTLFIRVRDDYDVVIIVYLRQDRVHFLCPVFTRELREGKERAVKHTAV